MFLIGLCIHLVFLFSIFDIYFKSPIINEVESYVPQYEAVADRLVLFIVDGLRAESFLNYTTMPYLRSVANTHGRWGISHTRVPTESRPGHIAVIAGFYEDPSAVAKGWKDNPVDFDSVFNQTTYTWCWGAYDIINIFTKGNDHIFANKYDAYDQTFSTNVNTTLLDSWVFENAKDYLSKVKNNSETFVKLHTKKIALFFHLLGTDTSGHTHKPKTKNFLTTIRFVDEGIKEMEAFVKKFYEDDKKTTFLMTSDHGMTDWGSHGAGDDHETMTPYVLWGAGVKQTVMKQLDPHTNNMSLDHRFDVNQADMAPLMSTILSIPVPVNSIGQLPADILNMSLADKAKAVYSNSRQLASQYNKKRMNVEANAIPILYKPYEPLNQKKYSEIISISEKLLANEDYEKLILLSEEIKNLSLSGLEYYHNYYQTPLLVLVTLSFVGWIAYLLTELLIQSANTHLEVANTKILIEPKTNTINIIFVVISMMSIYIVYAQNFPYQYYLYFLLPLILWWRVIAFKKVWTNTILKFWRNGKGTKVILKAICYICGSLSMGMSFSQRWILSVPLLGMGLWPIFSSKRKQLPLSTLILWPFGCVLLSVFSFTPVVGKETFIELVITAGVLWLVITSIYVWNILVPLWRTNKEDCKELVLTGTQNILLIVSLHNIYSQSQRFDKSEPVSHFYQICAWMIAVVSLLIPICHSKRIVCRITAIYTSILNIYLLLSVSHEGLFMISLIFNIALWILIEFKLIFLDNVDIFDVIFGEEVIKLNSIKVDRSITEEDFRRAFFFLLYIILAFFGTGNISSLNSFEVRWVTCFITSFHPFIITGLILLKTLSPFLCVGCSLGAVQHITKAPTGYLNIIVLIYSNIMGAQLLYYVKNIGSWLEIGTSISQFVIVQVITLFIVIINQLAKVLTDWYFFYENVFKSRKKLV